MNKMTRRILALTLTVCTLLSVMAPTVFAAPEAKTYSFTHEAVQAAVGSNATLSTPSHNIDAATKTAIENAYDTLGWKFGTTDMTNTNQLYNDTGYYKGLRLALKANSGNDNKREGYWVSFPIKTPNAGKYSFDLYYAAGSKGVSNVGFYMVSYTGEITQDNVDDMIAGTAVEGATLTKLGNYSCTGTNSTGSAITAPITLSENYTFDGTSNYMIVLRADSVNSNTEQYIYIRQLALTPVVETPELDPTDTYDFSLDYYNQVTGSTGNSDLAFNSSPNPADAIAEAFDNTQSYWKIGDNYNAHLTSNLTMFQSARGLRIRMNTTRATTNDPATRIGSWVSFPLAAPATGEHAFVMSHGTHATQGMQKVGVYMISYTGDTAPDVQTALDNGSATYVGDYSCDKDGEGEALAQTSLANTYTFDEDTNYILVLKALEDRESTEDSTYDTYIYINQLSLVDPVASVGSTNYGSVSAAIEAAGSGTVKLESSATEDVILTNGVTLDLAGNTLTGYVTAGGDAGSGKVIDSVGGGLVMCDKGDSLFNADNSGYLPLYDSTKSGYSFYTYTAKKLAQDDNGDAKFWFDIDFTNNAAYSLLGDNMTLSGKLTWAGSTSGSLNDRIFPVQTIKGMADAESANADKDYALYLKVTGIDELVAGDTLTASFVGNVNGVEITYSITHTITE